MAFDQQTRNRLARFVGDARTLLSDEFTRQLQNDCGLDPASGDVAETATLGHLDDAKRATARILRDMMQHYLASADTSKEAKAKKARQDVLSRIIREQAFTVLNRLCALRMAEARDLLLESVAKGYQSKGFQLYSRPAGTALGETGHAYRCYLFSVFDEFAVDLPVLFDRFSPQGRLFPRDSVLLSLLELINDSEMEPLWPQDETIGWIYQYFNTPEERRQMRAESQAPRNSRELAVRNQFFTPRYVVEFLTDNTLGRIWYEMTQGQTSLKDTCRYLVRRPDEVFLSATTDPEAGFPAEGSIHMAKLLQEGSEEDWPEFQASDESIQSMIDMAHCVDGYARHPHGEGWHEWFSVISETLHSGRFVDLSTQELLDGLFMTSRADRHGGDGSVYKKDWFIAAANEVRRRALKSRESDLTQEELLRQPAFIPYRPKKDPRDIKMLDPACGSMHFGLYAFDLFERIYDEYFTERLARDDEESHDVTEPEDSRLQPADYPHLIIERNIHGIDIDPRAVQIAGLSLWLRAQRSWRDLGIKAQNRPRIERSNVVCAEPMPGNAEMREQFIEQLRPKVLGQLVGDIFEKMELAGEAGSLLKIEDEIANAIQTAHEEYKKYLLQKKDEAGYLPGLAPKRQPTLFDFADLPDAKDFWNRAEAIVLAELEAYADRAENGGAFQRRLFAGDASRGFAFIDVCRNRYDVVLMNPPFGAATSTVASYLSSRYPNAKNDLYTSFVDALLKRLHPSGRLGAITSRSAFFLGSFERYRERILLSEGICHCIADLGYGVLDAKIETAAYVIAKPLVARLQTRVDDACLFLPLLSQPEKGDSLLSQVNSLNCSSFTTPLVVRRLSQFAELPAKPFAYHISERLLDIFRTYPRFETGERHVATGVQTSDDFRFLRFWWEVPTERLLRVGDLFTDNIPTWQQSCALATTKTWWCPFAKGGEYAPFLNEPIFVISWKNDGAEVKAYAETTPGTKHWSRNVRNAECYYRPGLSYSARTSIRLCAPALPAGAIISNEAGPGIYVPMQDLHVSSARFNSLVAESLCLIGQARGLEGDDQTKKYTAGLLQALPWPNSYAATQDDNVRKVFDAIHRLRSCDDNSRYFVAMRACSLEDLRKTAKAIWLVESEVATEYGLDALTVMADCVGHSVDELGAIEEIGRTLQISLFPLTETQAHRWISYAVGCVFGRWHIDAAEQGPQAFDPFAPLEQYPPAMLAKDRHRGSSGISKSTKVLTAENGIATSESSHSLYLFSALRRTLDDIRQQSSEVDECELCQQLGVDSLENYFNRMSGFFGAHLSRTSQSRRSAPIYWPLSTPSGSFTLWLYYHRLTDQTLYTCVNDFVDPKLRQVAGEAEALRRKTGRSGDDERQLERLTDLEHELTDLREELLRLARFWKPNPNDGVQITAAPLWKLFQHRPWQNKLKETWDALEAGDYDWAHLAMSIWPERVVPKCVTDRSLAIAHDLECLFWVEDFDKWRNLNEPDEEIEEQKRRQRRPARVNASKLLEKMAADQKSDRTGDVFEHLDDGDWDDCALALLVWPERVAEKCWDDAGLAAKLKVKLPEGRTKASRKRFIEALVSKGCPDLAGQLEAALKCHNETFGTSWEELAQGSRDDELLTLSLWPDRVIDKCTEDIELAKAHNIHRFFWVQHPTDSWRRRVSPKTEVTNEINRRKGQS